MNYEEDRGLVAEGIHVDVGEEIWGYEECWYHLFDEYAKGLWLLYLPPFEYIYKHYFLSIYFV